MDDSDDSCDTAVDSGVTNDSSIEVGKSSSDSGVSVVAAMMDVCI